MGKKLKRKQENSQVFGKEPGDRAFFEEEYIKRAEAMERALFGDEDSEEGEEVSEEEEAASYEKLVRRLKAEGIYREDEATDKERKQVSGRNSSKVIFRSRIIRRCLSRAAIIAVLCCACMFTVSMTSEANRNYFVEKIQYMMGNDTKIIADNDERNELPGSTEQEAIKEIETALGVDVPEFYYRPERFEFYNYSIDNVTDIAKMEYQYNGKIICFVIDKQDEDTASRTMGTNGRQGGFSVISPDGIQIMVEEIKEEQDILPTYTAMWERENVIYWFTGKIKKQELNKILKDIVY